jgi:hypothetical protein
MYPLQISKCRSQSGMRLDSYVDGEFVKGKYSWNHNFRKAEGVSWVIEDRRMSAQEVQKLVFAKPVSCSSADLIQFRQRS